MQASTFPLTTSDGVSLLVYRWLPDAPPRAVVQIAHGLAEHAARYAPVAEALGAPATRFTPTTIAGMAAQQGQRPNSAFSQSATAGRNALMIFGSSTAELRPTIRVCRSCSWGTRSARLLRNISSANTARRSLPQCSLPRAASRRLSRWRHSCSRALSDYGSGNAAAR